MQSFIDDPSCTVGRKKTRRTNGFGEIESYESSSRTEQTAADVDGDGLDPVVVTEWE